MNEDEQLINNRSLSKQYKIAIASDHRGLALKSYIRSFLQDSQHITTDLGPFTEEVVDYTDYAYKLCDEILTYHFQYGILICSTGIGMSIAANRSHGIRAALCINDFMGQMARAHNDANVLVIASAISSPIEAIKITEKFLSTDFDGGRHKKRINKLDIKEL